MKLKENCAPSAKAAKRSRPWEGGRLAQARTVILIDPMAMPLGNPAKRPRTSKVSPINKADVPKAPGPKVSEDLSAQARREMLPELPRKGGFHIHNLVPDLVAPPVVPKAEAQEPQEQINPVPKVYEDLKAQAAKARREMLPVLSRKGGLHIHNRMPDLLAPPSKYENFVRATDDKAKNPYQPTATFKSGPNANPDWHSGRPKVDNLQPIAAKNAIIKQRHLSSVSSSSKSSTPSSPDSISSPRPTEAVPIWPDSPSKNGHDLYENYDHRDWEALHYSVPEITQRIQAAGEFFPDGPKKTEPNETSEKIDRIMQNYKEWEHSNWEQYAQEAVRNHNSKAKKRAIHKQKYGDQPMYKFSIF